jgi:hypothetical protein
MDFKFILIALKDINSALDLIDDYLPLKKEPLFLSNLLL